MHQEEDATKVGLRLQEVPGTSNAKRLSVFRGRSIQRHSRKSPLFRRLVVLRVRVEQHSHQLSILLVLQTCCFCNLLQSLHEQNAEQLATLASI